MNDTSLLSSRPNKNIPADPKSGVTLGKAKREQKARRTATIRYPSKNSTCSHPRHARACPTISLCPPLTLHLGCDQQARRGRGWNGACSVATVCLLLPTQIGTDTEATASVQLLRSNAQMAVGGWGSAGSIPTHQGPPVGSLVGGVAFRWECVELHVPVGPQSGTPGRGLA